MPTRDPYDVLGVPRDASQDEIKSSYRRLARRYHPDVNPGDPESEEKFKEIGEAYSILSDPEKRARFDQFGTVDDQFAGNINFQGGFGDIFEMFFGSGGQTQSRGGARNGEDLRGDVSINLQEVLSGAHRDITVNRLTTCEDCNGTGAEKGTSPEVCANCKGQGVIGQIRQTILGQMRTSMTCPTCQGAGKTIKSPCPKCHGRGLNQEKARVAITIPPGVDHGATMHIPGQGNEGVGGGRPGDLYVVIEVDEDKRFQRHGQTLYTTLDLTFAQASLGDEVAVPGVDAPVELVIPAGIQPGERLSVKGAGLPPLHGGKRGDLIVGVTVKVPTKLTEAQVALIKEFAEVSGESIPKGESQGILGGFFKKKK
jgi:molecular chaperone DnaJ